jgi:molecular chaperone DnaK
MTDSTAWTLAVDFGTSFTVAAIRVGTRAPEAIEIGGDRRVPSVVLVAEEGVGAPRIDVGRVAEDLSSTRPGSVLRAPKRRLGEPAPVVLGGRPYQVVDLVGALLRHVYDEAVRHQGSPPARLCLTHPATWSRPRLARLLESAAKVGLPEVTLIAEPVAAALAYASDSSVPDGAHVAVYDLGGGTFDTTVLRADGGSFTVIGRPGGDANLGGELFDELLVNLVGERLDPAVWDELQVSDELPWRQAAAALRNEVRRAKESLSSSAEAGLLLPLPGGMVHEKLSRADLEGVVGPYIDESVRLLVQSVRDAGVDPADLASVYLVGGASRMPIVEQKLTAALPGTVISRRGDPKTVVAVGATLAEPTGSVLDLQAAGGRTTLESQPVIGASVVPPPPAPAVGEQMPSDARLTVVGSTVAGGGTVIESPAAAASALPPPPPMAAPLPPAPATAPRSKTPVIAGAIGAGVLLLGGLGFALTRGGDTKAAITTTTTEAPTTTAAKPVGSLSLPPLTPSSSPPKSTVATTVPVSASQKALTGAQAEQVLPTLAELETATGKTGWVEVPFQSGPPLCGLTAPDAPVERHFVIGRSEGNLQAVQIASSVASYASAADLAANVAALKKAVTACPEPTSVEEGVTFTLKFSDLTETPIPLLDYSFAFAVLANAPGYPSATNVFVVAGVGRTAIQMQYQVFGRAPTDAESSVVASAFGELMRKFLLQLV